MDCKSCRASLYAYAEKLNGEDSLSWDDSGLSEELRRHLSKCSSCAALATSLSMLNTEKALHFEISEHERMRIARGVMDRITASSPGKDDGEIEIPGSREKSSWRGFLSGKLGRAASLASAAVLLIAVSVSLTLNFTGDSSAGVSAEASGPQNKAEQVALDEAAPEMGGRTVTVHLRLDAPEAKSVAVVGDWNGWDPAQHRMKDANEDGVWELTLSIEKGGEYQYQFLINGEKWMPDPNAALKVEDGFGGTNSVLNI